MAKKKELNAETEYYSAALKIAVKLDKDAMVVWNDGYMVIPTPVGTVHIPCQFELSVAVKADDLIKAFKGCDKTFIVSEHHTQVSVEWGRKHALLDSRPKVSVYARHRDQSQGQSDLDPKFTAVLRDVLKDLTVKQDITWSQVIQFGEYVAYWTDRKTAAKIDTGVWMPPILLWVKDLRGALTREGNIVAMFGSASTVTFYWDDGVAIQLPLVDDSAVKFPDVAQLFEPTLFEAEYDLTEEHIDAFDFVAGFAEQVIYIEPTFIGTTPDFDNGTVVTTDGLPIQTQIFADSVKLGALRNATKLVKLVASRDSIAFMVKRDNFMFLLTRAKRQ